MQLSLNITNDASKDEEELRDAVAHGRTGAPQLSLGTHDHLLAKLSSCARLVPTPKIRGSHVTTLSLWTTDPNRPPLSFHCHHRLGSIVEGSVLVDESTDDYILFTTSDGLVAKLPTAHCADHPAQAQGIREMLLNQDDPARVSE